MAGGILCFFCCGNGNVNPYKLTTECYCFGKGEYYKYNEDLEFKRKLDILNNINCLKKVIHIKDNKSLMNALNKIEKDTTEDVEEKIYYFNTKTECIQYVTNYYETQFKKYNIV
jgi:hypothetical protein